MNLPQRLLADYDRPLGVARRDLCHGAERVEEEGEEAHAASTEERGGVVGHGVEDGAGDERLEGVGHEDGEEGDLVALIQLALACDGKS
jgi:hypothetical protein